MPRVLESSLLFAESVRIEADQKTTIIGTFGSAVSINGQRQAIRLGIFCRFLLEPTSSIPERSLTVRQVSADQDETKGVVLIDGSDPAPAFEVERQEWERTLPLAANMAANLDLVVTAGDRIIAEFRMGDECRTGILHFVDLSIPKVGD